MGEKSEMTEQDPHNLLDRANALATFEKIERAIELIEEAIKERPILKDLQMEPLLRSLAVGLRILSSKDSELDLQGLMLKHEWRVGQRFFVRVEVRSASECSFVVLPGQDIPEGIVVALGNRRHLDVQDGEHVALNLEIHKSAKRVGWRIRAIDRE